MKEFKGSIDVSGIKRCYLEDCKIVVKCPTCNSKLKETFEDDYLSYPVVGKKDSLSIYCKKCDDWTEFPMVVKSAIVTLSIDTLEIK